MISATGNPRRPAAGFSLLEILLALAIIALVSSLAAAGVGGMIRALDRKDPVPAFWQAVTSAREMALSTGAEVGLTVDRSHRRLRWGHRADQKSGSLELPAGSTLHFFRETPGAAVLLGGELRETEEIARVRFHADGTCEAFRVELRAEGFPGRKFGIDPWTCAAVLSTTAAADNR
jgi:prepilin-type N-terminal cleavage/methylation domain-containing protein